MIQCVRSSNCIENVFITYFFLKRNFSSKRNHAGTFAFSGDMFSNVINLALRDSDADSKKNQMARKHAVQMVRFSNGYIINQFIYETHLCNFLFVFMKDKIHQKKVKMQHKETIFSLRVNPH